MKKKPGVLYIAAAWVAMVSCSSHAVVALPAYNVDTSQITVSGLSAGGFMANQLGYAYSSTFKGVGVFAGGPYMCAGHSNYTACMYNATITASMLNTMQADINNWSAPRSTTRPTSPLRRSTCSSATATPPSAPTR